MAAALDPSPVRIASAINRTGLNKPFECTASTMASFCRNDGKPSREHENHSIGDIAGHVDFSQLP
jgi:hypothetical protein